MPVNILMPALSPMRARRNDFKWLMWCAALLLVTAGSQVSLGAQSTSDTIVGPLSVQRFHALKERLGVNPNAPMLDYFKNATYNSVMNLLIDNILQSEGTRFCLPSKLTSLSVGQAFYEMVPLIDEALKQPSAPEEGDLRRDSIRYLSQKFPCKIK